MSTAPHSGRGLRHHRDLQTPEEQVHGFYVHLIVYLCVNVGLAILNFRRNPEHLWFYWVVAGWGIGIVSHALRVFVLNPREAHASAVPVLRDSGIPSNELPPTSP